MWLLSRGPDSVHATRLNNTPRSKYTPRLKLDGVRIKIIPITTTGLLFLKHDSDELRRISLLGHMELAALAAYFT